MQLRESTRQHEELTAVWFKSAWHAIYPTATTTLCLEHCTVRGTPEAFPTCEICQRVSARMYEIDRSCPVSWKWLIEGILDERRAR